MSLEELSDEALVAALRARGGRARLMIANVFERALSPTIGPRQVLEDARAEALSLGKDPSKLVHSTEEELLADLRESACSLLRATLPGEDDPTK